MPAVVHSVDEVVDGIGMRGRRGWYPFKAVDYLFLQLSSQFSLIQYIYVENLNFVEVQ